MSSEPGGNSSPGFTAASVIVRSAASTGPSAWPVSPSTPLGMSTASTAASPIEGGSHAPWKPEPKAASMTRSASGKLAGHEAVSNTRTRTPRSRSHRAATRPSAPLLPGPAITFTVRP